MHIQGINQSAANHAPARQGNLRLEALDQQISNLQKNIQDTNKNEKLDSKTKTEKVKEYQTQIQMLQQEKAQIQAEERKAKQEAAKNDRPAAEQDDVHVVDEHVQNAFVKMDSMKKTETQLGVAREKAKGELRIAESNSFLRVPDPATAAEARATIAKIDGEVLRKGAEVSEELEKASYESASSEEKTEQENEGESISSGTGRMEPGQFLNDEA